MFQSISIISLVQSIVSEFRNTRNGAWYFHLFQSLFQFSFEMFQNVRTILSISFMFQSVSITSLYNPLSQCFKTPEIGTGIFTFSRACLNFVSKHFQTTETFLVNFLHVSVRFINFPYTIHCFSVSKHQKWVLVFSPFPELVSSLFRNVSKRSDLVNFLHVSVRFNNFPI